MITFDVKRERIIPFDLSPLRETSDELNTSSGQIQLSFVPHRLLLIQMSVMSLNQRTSSSAYRSSKSLVADRDFEWRCNCADIHHFPTRTREKKKKDNRFARFPSGSLCSGLFICFGHFSTFHICFLLLCSPSDTHWTSTQAHARLSTSSVHHNAHIIFLALVFYHR